MNIKLISHRGNTNGKCGYENSPKHIYSVIDIGYDVEVDLWVTNNRLWLGHDKPQYEIYWNWLKSLSSKLWIHCKSTETLIAVRAYDNISMINNEPRLNYFFHNNDDIVLTSKNFLWHYPGKGSLSMWSVGVLPELNNNWNLNICYGVCSDYVEMYK